MEEEKQKITVLINPNNLPEKLCNPHDGGMQYGVSQYSQIFDAISAHNRGFTQTLITTKQVGFSRDGDNSGLVDNKVRNAPSMNLIYMKLK
jgi:hypothetical protein